MSRTDTSYTAQPLASLSHIGRGTHSLSILSVSRRIKVRETQEKREERVKKKWRNQDSHRGWRKVSLDRLGG